MVKPQALSRIPAYQLQELMVRCGLPKTGAKLLLYNRIRTAAREHKPLAADSRILSIDMGLKNFAYSLLTLPQKPEASVLTPPKRQLLSDKRKVTKKPKPSESNNDGAIFTADTFDKLLEAEIQEAETTNHVADLHVWRHLNLLPWLEVNNIDGRNTDAIGEQFAPNAMADMAYRLITEHILPQRPTHILIERQRFRTGNGAGIFEWTVRVNMLESMIYAILRVMQNAGKFKGVVVPVPPKRVVNYLMQTYGEENPQERLPGKRNIKAKVPLGAALDQEISPEEDKEDELLSPFEPPINVAERETKKALNNVKKVRMALLAEWFRKNEKIGLANEEMRRMAYYFVRNTDVACRNLLLTNQKLKNEAVEMPPVHQLPKSLGVGTFMGKLGEKPERLTKGEHIEKMDDLCDSVTQGLAWIEWGLELEKAMENSKWIMEDNEEPEKPKLGIPVMKRTWGKGL
ncbi:mitochondrial resolvase Ydc2 [Sordaria brevicollis]|uniref:Mitochondrial resolvase Ydc2 n=1 Tax=Sordaria brevicollis TaxID=83679 RepID=A0AAE0P328_SORBR|nr:mitochondrial resolvase Ydc2 [Sordaria brevicollis]